uniref:G-protein coupled receptors family 1 profile domain-containing protein n=1 Tax=Monopterus albus TaxID=43700 RepID=A0A3Q3JV75_MONAL
GIYGHCSAAPGQHFVEISATVLKSLLVSYMICVFLAFLSRQLHTPTNFFVLSLAVSDFFVGLLMFFQIMLIDGCWLLGNLMCVVYQYLSYIITSASVGTMVLICVDRYVAICDPLHYPTKVTQKRVQVYVCLCWTCSVIYSGLLLKDNLEQPGRHISCSGECVVVGNYIAGVADLVLSFIGPVIVIIFLYMRVFVVAVSQARAMRSHIATVTLQCSVSVTVKKSELKAALTLGVVVVVFLICLCPYYTFIVILTTQDTSISASSAASVICLFYFNSCLNPVIYAFFYPWFRKCVKAIVTLQILQPDSSEANIL